VSDILIQFHALVDELIDPIKSYVEAEKVHVTALVGRPFSARETDPGALEATLKDPTVTELIFTIGPHHSAATTLRDFREQTPDALSFEIGRLEGDALKESALSGRTYSAAVLAKWQPLAKRLRKILHAGATAVNPVTGATGKVPSHRYSDGAKQLQQRGTRMLPVAGGSLYRFDE
jgi:hypothetical protein